MPFNNEKLQHLANQNGGIITADDMKKININRVELKDSIKKGFVMKESHGNYVLTSDQPDEYRVLQNHSDKIIFSHSTALFLHGLTDRVPHILDVTVPQGDNVSRIKKRYEKTNFHYCKKELWNIGIVDIKSPQGYNLRVYDLDRCICDLVKNKNSVDMQTYTQAIKKYFKSYCNPRKIIKYAKLLNVEYKIRNYMEVL